MLIAAYSPNTNIVKPINTSEIVTKIIYRRYARNNEIKEKYSPSVEELPSFLNYFPHSRFRPEYSLHESLIPLFVLDVHWDCRYGNKITPVSRTL